MKISVLSLLLIALLSNGCSSSSSSNGTSAPANPANPNPAVTIKNAKPGIGAIVVIGDSLAAGVRAVDPAVKPINCLTQLPNTFTQDLAVPGLTSAQILNKISQVESLQPKLVFVSSGGNDVLSENARPGTYPENRTLSEMTTLFDKLIATGATVAYLSLNPPVPYAKRLPEIAKLAYSKGVILVDGMKDLWENPSLMADQIHPNDVGYKIMCDRTLAAINSYYP